MINLKQFEKYKSDAVCVLILSAVYLLSMFYTNCSFGNLIVDCGREVYIPEMILDGKSLYKDIFVLYNPFSYLLNALLYLIFGIKFKVLFHASYINAFIIILSVYAICRKFVNAYYSMVFSISVLLYFIAGCYFSVVSYIFPYSYAFIYAVTFFTGAVLAFLHYMETDNKKFAYLSGILAGLVYACKAEFLLFALPCFIVFFLKKENFRTYFIFCISLSLPFLISGAILFMTGTGLEDFKHYCEFIINMINTDEQKFLNEKNITPLFNKENLKIILSDFLFTSAFFAGSALYATIFGRVKNHVLNAIFFIIFCSICIWSVYAFPIDGNENLFSWQVIPLIIVLCFKVRKLNTLKEQMLFFTAVQGILSMWRIGFLPLHKFGYGIYFLLPLLSLWVYLIKSVNKKYAVYFCVTLITLSWYPLSIFEDIKDSYSEYIYENDKGKIVSEGRYGEVFKNSEEWIKENTAENETVIVLPEGSLLNHVTGRKTNPKYYQLPPNHISAFGEENIIRDLEFDKPSYILINDFSFDIYGTAHMCEDFGFGICNFVTENYSLEAEFRSSNKNGTEFNQKIYKLKK